MPEFHRLDADADARFLRARVADPLTQTPFQPANSVVLCGSCGLVSLRETWEALGGCPNGHDVAARWDPATALGAGDGAATPPPRPASAVRTSAAVPASVAPAAVAPPPAARARWVTPFLVALGVAGLAVAGVVAFGLLQSDDPEPPEAGVVETVEPTGPTGVSLTEPGLTEGRLADGDYADESGRYQDLYTFAADSSGKVVSFTVTSDDFFPELVVQTPEGDRLEAETIESDDDTGTRVVAVRDLRNPGLYRVLITSRLPAASGSYSLRVRQEVPTRPLTPGGSAVQAELGAFSERADGFFRDRYQFSGSEEQEHTLTVRTSAFAPTLQVTGPDGAVRGQTGRAGGVVTYVFTPTRSGTHTVVVSSQSRGQKGAYSVQLAVEKVQEEAAVRVEPPSAGTLRPNAVTSDSLASGASASYSMRGRTGDRVFLEVRADGFTPSLVLIGPDGTRTAASPDGDRARVRYTLPGTGTYRVVVGASGGSGDFRLSLEQQAAVTGEEIPRTPGADTPRESRGRDEGERPPDGDQPQPVDGGQGTR